MAGTDDVTVAPTANDRTVVARFFTNTFDDEMPQDQTFNIPYTVTPHGMSELVNKVLGLDEPVRFDFLINDEFITVSLDKFMKARSINREEVTLDIEYTPAVSVEDGNEIPHDDWVSSVSAPLYNEREEVLVTGSYDRRVRICDGAEIVAVGDGHRAAVKEVIALPNNSTAKGGKKRQRTIPGISVLSASKDGTVKAWKYSDAKGMQCVRTIAHHRDSVDTVAVSLDGALACSGSWDKTVKLFRFEDCFSEGELQTAELVGHSRPVLKCRFGHTGRSLYTTGLDGQVKEWDVGSGKFVATFSGEYACYAMDVKLMGDVDAILTGHSDNRCRLWDVREKRPVKTFSGHLGWVYDIRWCPEGCVEGSGTEQHFVSAAEDGELHVHDLRAQRNLSSHHIHTDGILGMCFVSTQTVATGSKDTTIKTTTLGSAQKPLTA